ncbi:MAG: methylated-DNA--[protein]-cysteine S-methyltransferase [Fibrobacteria bacterium]|nr:methylated-DNA--[protein]-cysteine S-methyltransferase [Fibrobacteria bacterium]
MNTIFYTNITTAFGPMKIYGQKSMIHRVCFDFIETQYPTVKYWKPCDFFHKEAKAIKGFLSGDKNAIDALCWQIPETGTDFQQKVWKQIQGIPTGKTLSYGSLAQKIGNPRSARAVGNACNANPFLFLVPCHRVVGHNTIGGFGWGLERKESLLALEHKM